MTKKKELNVEELEQVNGGKYESLEGAINIGKYSSIYNKPVSIKDVVKGQDYLFFDTTAYWFVGTVISTGESGWEELGWCVIVNVKDGYFFSTDIDPYLNERRYTVYEYYNFKIYSK